MSDDVFGTLGDDDILEEEEQKPKTAAGDGQNRTFIIAVAVLGGLLVCALLSFGVWALVLNRPQEAETRIGEALEAAAQTPGAETPAVEVVVDAAAADTPAAETPEPPLPLSQRKHLCQRIRLSLRQRLCLALRRPLFLRKPKEGDAETAAEDAAAETSEAVEGSDIGRRRPWLRRR